MILKSHVSIEVTKNERTYTLHIPVGSPFGEAHDVAQSMVQQIAHMAQEAASKGESDGK